MLNIRVQKLGNTTVLHCVGRIAFPDADPLRTLSMQGSYSRCLVLDLANVTGIDASGLGALVFLRSWSKESGRSLKLMNVNPSVKKLLELTNLKSEFEMCSAREMLDLLCRAIRATEPEILEAPPQTCNDFMATSA